VDTDGLCWQCQGCRHDDICNQWTAEEVIGRPAWRAEMKIVEGVVELLKVPECYMLNLEDVPELIS